MDEIRPIYRFKVPNSGSASSLRLPGRDSFPGVDDHLVEPEVTCDEIIGSVQAKLWQEWMERGSQGPIEDDGDPELP
ncbi:MAG TPA: hypothetical protein VKK31_07685 [Thermoanaerobaculia bacterium]|nr:hypothetical protein [Thermoanaerobaculia bacterium]